MNKKIFLFIIFFLSFKSLSSPLPYENLNSYFQHLDIVNLDNKIQGTLNDQLFRPASRDKLISLLLSMFAEINKPNRSCINHFTDVAYNKNNAINWIKNQNFITNSTNKKNSVIDLFIHNAQTLSGKVFLACLASNPEHQNERIQEKIDFIRFLVEKPVFLLKTKSLIKSVIKIEEKILNYLALEYAYQQRVIQAAGGSGIWANRQKFVQNILWFANIPLQLISVKETIFGNTPFASKAWHAFITSGQIYRLQEEFLASLSEKQVLTVLENNIHDINRLFSIMRKYKALYNSKSEFEFLKYYGLVDNYEKHHNKNNRSVYGAFFNDALTISNSYKNSNKLNLTKQKIIEFTDDLHFPLYNISFFALFEALGELDAYVTIANLVRESQKWKFPVHFSIPELIEYDRPIILGKNIWTPLISPSVVVGNDVQLDDQTNTMIITGSNTGGKSTYLHAILSNLWLAQSFGIAAADLFQFTPFYLIQASQDIASSLTDGESLFQAQVNNIQTIYQNLTPIAEDQFSILFIDEMLTGTSTQYATNAARKIIEDLSARKNQLTLYTSHFPEVTSLADENSQIKNFNFHATVQQGKIITDYKLRKGAANQDKANIANEILDYGLSEFGFNFLSNKKMRKKHVKESEHKKLFTESLQEFGLDATN